MREDLYMGRKKGSTEWVYGYLAAYDLISPSYPKDVSNSLGEYHGDTPYVGFIEVDPATVSRYIGMKDRNKERLFDGDIIRFKTWKDGTLCWVGVISFDYCSFIVKGGPNKESHCPFEIQMSRVNDT